MSGEYVREMNDAIDSLRKAERSLCNTMHQLRSVVGKTSVVNNLDWTAECLHNTIVRLETVFHAKLDSDLKESRELEGSLMSAVVGGAFNLKEPPVPPV